MAGVFPLTRSDHFNDNVNDQASLLRKAAGPSGTVSLVDIYGTILGSRLLVPSDTKALNPQHLSLHMMRRNIDRGQCPLPISTAIQHSDSDGDVNMAGSGEQLLSTSWVVVPQDDWEMVDQ